MNETKQTSNNIQFAFLRTGRVCRKIVERPGEHFAEARQIQASYWIVQAPELCAAQLLTVMTELLSAAAVTLVIMAGTARTLSKRILKNMT